MGPVIAVLCWGFSNVKWSHESGGGFLIRKAIADVTGQWAVVAQRGGDDFAWHIEVLVQIFMKLWKWKQ